jgi:hypothetical protein
MLAKRPIPPGLIRTPGTVSRLREIGKTGFRSATRLQFDERSGHPMRIAIVGYGTAG